MEAKLVMIVVEGRIELVRPVDPTAIDDHHHLFVGFPKGRHDLVQILSSLLGIKVGHDFIEDFRGAILDGADDTQQHTVGDATPRAILQPRLAFQGLLTFNLTLTQRAYGKASALGCAPPACARQRKAPQDGFVFIEQNNLATASLVLEGGKFESAVGEISRGGIQAAGGAVKAQRIFFKTPRTLSRPRWTPVSRAKTVASSRQLHWEWREPCSRGS